MASPASLRLAPASHLHGPLKAKKKRRERNSGECLHVPERLRS